MSQSENTKEKVVNGFFWRYLERTCAQGIQMMVSLVLARILLPEQYGVVSLVTVFINIALVFVQSGFGNALIQKKNADIADFSTVFYFSVFLGLVLYGVMFWTAPLIGRFYQYEELVPVIRVLSLSLILAGVNSVQQAYVSRTMQFKKFFFSTIAGSVCSAFAGIAAAVAGWGVWALVLQQLTNQTMDTVILWIISGWRPARVFSRSSFKETFSYGWKLLCSSLIDTLYSNLYILIIGKSFSSSDVGFVEKGKQFPALIIVNINATIQSVMFPALSSRQTDREKLKGMTRRAIMTSSFVVFPCMAGLAVIAKKLIVVLLTEKWLPAVPFLQYYAFIYALWPVHTANLQAINAVGRSDIYLKLEVTKKVCGILILVFTFPLGLHAMMIGSCINAVIGLFLNALPNTRILDYHIKELMRDLMPAVFLSAAMALAVAAVGKYLPEGILGLIIQAACGAFLYLSGAALFQVKSFVYIKDTVKQMRDKNYGKEN